eukprot:7635354-Karenia_brevis.AAC.1
MQGSPVHLTGLPALALVHLCKLMLVDPHHQTGTLETFDTFCIAAEGKLIALFIAAPAHNAH